MFLKRTLAVKNSKVIPAYGVDSVHQIIMLGGFINERKL
jgi:hypothetical protein